MTLPSVRPDAHHGDPFPRRARWLTNRPPVTGAARGKGDGLARRLIHGSWHVVLGDLDEAACLRGEEAWTSGGEEGWP